MRISDYLNSFRQYLSRGRQGRRPEQFRTRLQFERLEDRLVLSTATQFGSTLNIIADPGTATSARTILLQVDPVNPTKLDVKDGTTSLGQFAITSINQVHVQVAGNDVIEVNDSNGFPFAPGTNIALFGGGADNKLSVVGSRAVSGTELFDAGTATQNGLLSLAGSTFRFTGAVPRVADEVANAGSLQVQTTAPAVRLTGADGVIETLSGLAGTGGGNILSFRGKANVDLQLRGNNETATLDATAAAQGLTSFTVEQFGGNDTVTINATPSFAGIPLGGTFVDNPGQQDLVNVRASSGPVNIFGTSSTTVILGSNATNFSQSVTSGINGLVSVANAGVLDIADGGNVTTKENVTVTESTVSGTGLFGAHGSVHYSSLTPGLLTPSIFTGQLSETYTVTTSQPGASFNSQGRAILISDASTTGGLSVHVLVNANSDLSLSLVSKDPAVSSLFISAPAGSGFNPFVMTHPTGFEQVFAPGALHSSSVFYNGFASVGHS
jgi:hypothetical protein